MSSAILSYRRAAESLVRRAGQYLPGVGSLLQSIGDSDRVRNNPLLRNTLGVVVSVASMAYLNISSSQPISGNLGLLQSSIALHNSVYSYYRPLMEGYYGAVDRADEEASEDVKSAAELRKKIYDLSYRLDRSAYTVLGEKYLSLIVPPSVRYRSFVASAMHPESVRSAADYLYSRAFADFSKYRARDVNYLVDWVRGRRDLQKLNDLYSSLSDDYTSLGSIADKCASFLSKYRPHSSFARVRIPAIVSAMRSEKNVASRLLLCRDGLEMYSLDSNYVGVERMLSACERTASCWDDYNCSGLDPEKRLDCCISFLEKKRNYLRSTDLYSAYIRMLSKMYHIADFCGDDALRARLSMLPRNFTCADDLRKAVASLLSLSQKYGSAANCAPSNVFYDGFFDASEVSSVTVHFIYGIPGVDSRTVLHLPFRAAGYRIIDSNGLTVSIDGNVAVLKGSGSATVKVMAYPVPLSVEHVGDSLGRVRLRVSNTTDVPVRYRTDAVLLGSDGLVYRSGGYLYFPPHSSALVELPAIQVTYSESNRAVVLSNVTQYRYHGTVVLPFRLSSPPHYCTVDGNVTVCTLNVDPYASRILKGVPQSFSPIPLSSVSESNAANQPSSVLPAEVPVQPPMTSFQSPSATPRIAAPSALKKDILTFISELNSYYSRALELNVTYLLPFSAETLRSAEELLNSSDDSDTLHVLYNVLRDERDSLRAKARYSVAALRGVPGHEHDYSVAKSALASGDYVLALAVAEPLLSSNGGGGSVLPAVLGLLSLILLLYGLAISRKPRKRRRIPKI